MSTLAKPHGEKHVTNRWRNKHKDFLSSHDIREDNNDGTICIQPGKQKRCHILPVECEVTIVHEA